MTAARKRQEIHRPGWRCVLVRTEWEDGRPPVVLLVTLTEARVIHPDGSVDAVERGR